MKVYRREPNENWRLYTADAPDNSLFLEVGCRMGDDGSEIDIPPITMIDHVRKVFQRDGEEERTFPERWYRNSDLEWTRESDEDHARFLARVAANRVAP